MQDSAKPWTLEASLAAPTHDSAKPWAMPMQIAGGDSARPWGLEGSAGTYSGGVQTYRDLILATPGLLAYWRLDEPSGTSAADSKGSNTGIYGGTVTLGAAGAIVRDTDKAMAVAGAGSFRAPINLSGENKITVEFWLKWTAFANNDALALEFTADGQANAGGFTINPNESGSGAFQIGMNGGPAVRNYTRPSAGSYHHVVLTIDRTLATNLGGMQLYFDGVLQTPTGSVNSTPGGTFANSTLFAMSRNAASLFGTGSMDELAIYSGILSGATILAHYNNGINPNWALLPTGGRAKGSNFVPRRGTIAGAFNPNSWAEMWGEWEWSAAGSPGAAGNWLKPQVDLMKGLGCNTVRILGSQGCRTGSGSPYGAQISQATYLARWTQLLDYIRSQGMFVYPSMGGDSTISDFGSGYGYRPSNAFMLAEYQALATLFASYTDIIIGIDLFNEAVIVANAEITTFSRPLYNAVKAILPNVSLTWSYAWGAPPVDTSGFPDPSIADHWEVHIYFFDPNVAVLDGVYDMNGTLTPPRRVIIGEFGINDLSSSAVRQQRYAAVNAVNQHIGPGGRRCAGAIQWAIMDQGTTASSDHYGFYDANGNVRSDVIPAFNLFPTTM